MVIKTATAAPAPPLGKDAVADGAANGGGEITVQTLQQKIDDGTAEVSDSFVRVYPFCRWRKFLSLSYYFTVVACFVLHTLYTR